MNAKLKVLMLLLIGCLFVSNRVAYAHCDSFDGPTLKDAAKALETNNVNLVLKWVDEKNEEEIKDLFAKTYALQKGDQVIYSIVKRHFFETLVRLHRDGEGAPFTGLKPKGSVSKFIKMTDAALEDDSIDALLEKLNAHIEVVVKEKFNKTYELKAHKEDSAKKGREYVAAYVDYVHTLEAIHSVLEHGAGHHHE